jgi:hypothetical protein
MISKYFIWIVHVPIYHREFFWNFWEFYEYFSCFKIILDFSEIIFVQKINLENKLSYPIWPGRACGPDPHHRPSCSSPPPPLSLVCAPGQPRAPCLFKPSRVPVCPSCTSPMSPAPPPCSASHSIAAAKPSAAAGVDCSIRRVKALREQALAPLVFC